MDFKNKKCDGVFHASLFFFVSSIIFSLVMLFVAPLISMWIALLAIVPVFNMLGAGIVERKLSGEPFFKPRKHKQHGERNNQEEAREINQEREEQLEESREEQVEEVVEKSPEIEEVHEMGELTTPVEENKKEVKTTPIVDEVVIPKKPKETKKVR